MSLVKTQKFLITSLNKFVRQKSDKIPTECPTLLMLYCVSCQRANFFDIKLAQNRQTNGVVLPMTRKNKRFIISMPKIMRFSLTFEMLIKHLLGGNTAA